MFIKINHINFGLICVFQKSCGSSKMHDCESKLCCQAVQAELHQWPGHMQNVDNSFQVQAASKLQPEPATLLFKIKRLNLPSEL